MLNAEYEIEEPLEGWILKECEIDLDNEEWVTSTSDIVAAMQDAGVTGGTRAIQMGVAFQCLALDGVATASFPAVPVPGSASG